MDLGVKMAKAWWLPLFLVWTIPGLLLYISLTLILPQKPWVGVLVVWWCKPLWDQLSLYLASQRLFGEPITVRQTLFQFFSIIKTDWWCWLSFRRLSPTRSFDMPITTLEKLKGTPRNQRKGILHATASGAAFWLTMLFVHFELIFLYGILLLTLWMLPDHVSINWQLFINLEISWYTYLANTVYFLVIALVGPFYSMGGFRLISQPAHRVGRLGY